MMTIGSAKDECQKGAYRAGVPSVSVSYEPMHDLAVRTISSN